MFLAEDTLHPEAERVTGPADDRLKEALHDMRQPLSAVFALAECARATPGLPAQVADYLDQLIGQAAEIARVGRSALDPGGAPTEGPICAGEVITSVLESFGLTWGGRLVRRGVQGTLPVPGTWTAVRRCLVNILDNATYAAGPHGTVLVTLERGPEEVRILVEDDGPGFGRVVPRTGLGLTGSRRVLAPLGGSLRVGHSDVQGGTRVILSLPLLPATLVPSARVS